MFQKLISNLPYSPALVGQLGFYAKRLRQEQATRRLGLLFTVLALIVQSFAIIQPPEAANAAGYRDCSQNAIINCGALSMSELQQKYKQNETKDLTSIYNHFGVTSAMVASGNAKVGEALKNGNIVVNGRVVATGAHSLGRQNITGSRTLVSIAGKTYYSSPSQQIFASNSITVFAFFKPNGEFIAAIMLSCGNPVSATPTSVPTPAPIIPKPAPVVPKPAPKPIPAPIIPKPAPVANIAHHKKAVNLTQNGADATKVVAQAGDRILYTVTVENSGNAPATQPVSDKIDDVLEYASLQDNGGGTYNSTAGSIEFGSPTVKAHETIARSFIVQVANSIPSTPQGEANPSSFDCKMANIYGDTVVINVNCPPPKTVESVVKQLPSTGPGENMIFGTVILMVVTYFFVRSRQTGKEVRLIRHDFNMGTI